MPWHGCFHSNNCCSMRCYINKAIHNLIMWKEELGIIIQEGGIHEIEYKLQNNEVITFMVRNVSYYGQYCIVADRCTHSTKSYWMERKFTISKIKSIDNVPYDQSIAHLNYLRKCDEERKKKEKTNNSSSYSSAPNDMTEMKIGAMAFFGFLGLMFGGAAGGGIGAICGAVGGAFVGLWLIEARYNE